MPEGGTCTWCKGVGVAHSGTVLEGTCGWCDGTGVQKPSFHGYDKRECGEHRTVGPIRAWCFDCSEWCYSEDRELGGCKGCRLGAPVKVGTPS